MAKDQEENKSETEMKKYFQTTLVHDESDEEPEVENEKEEKEEESPSDSGSLSCSSGIRVV